MRYLSTSLQPLVSKWRVELASRQDDAIPDGVVFIPFAFVEAAANILTKPALDPFGKIPEFKFCAAKMEAVGPRMQAAE
jgi:formate dehydrogenase major subunit